MPVPTHGAASPRGRTAPWRSGVPPDLLAKLPEDQRGALLGILSQDPRPHYQKDPDRIYGMASENGM